MSWYLNNIDRLTNDDLPQTAINDLYSAPYPAWFWNLTAGKLTLDSQYLDLIPEPINSNLLEPPYPASFWYYDEKQKRLNLLLLPEELKPFSIYIGKQIKTIFIGDREVQAVYIGDSKV